MWLVATTYNKVELILHRWYWFHSGYSIQDILIGILCLLRGLNLLTVVGLSSVEVMIIRETLDGDPTKLSDTDRLHMAE